MEVWLFDSELDNVPCMGVVYWQAHQNPEPPPIPSESLWIVPGTIGEEAKWEPPSWPVKPEMFFGPIEKQMHMSGGECRILQFFRSNKMSSVAGFVVVLLFVAYATSDSLIGWIVGVGAVVWFGTNEVVAWWRKRAQE